MDREIDERGVLLSLSVDPEDVGRVIGKRGATAQSIRTLLRVLGTKNGARYNLKIVNTDEEGANPVEHDQPTELADAAEATAAADEAAATAAEGDDLAEKTRAELADLDDLDI